MCCNHSEVSPKKSKQVRKVKKTPKIFAPFGNVLFPKNWEHYDLEIFVWCHPPFFQKLVYNMFLRHLGSRVTLVWWVWMELVNLGTSRGAMICSMVPCSSLIACDLVSAVNFLFFGIHHCISWLMSSVVSLQGHQVYIQAEVKRKVLKKKRWFWPSKRRFVVSKLWIFSVRCWTMFSASLKWPTETPPFHLRQTCT